VSPEPSAAPPAPAAAAPPPPPPPPEVAPLRLVATLAVAGALAAVCLSFVYQATKATIQANKARVLGDAVRLVLHEPARVASLRREADALVRDETTRYLPDRIFVGYDADGRRLGFALSGEAYGYGSDPIRVVFAYDPATHEVLGLEVLEHKETPGIGSKIERGGPFADQLQSPVGTGARVRRPTPRQVPLVAARADQAPAAEAEVAVHEVDTVSGATISSRAVIRLVNEAVAAAGPLLEAWAREGE